MESLFLFSNPRLRVGSGPVAKLRLRINTNGDPKQHVESVMQTGM